LNGVDVNRTQVGATHRKGFVGMSAEPQESLSVEERKRARSVITSKAVQEIYPGIKVQWTWERRQSRGVR
jgi:hypothetical protein